jgi:hypothetical protein
VAILTDNHIKTLLDNFGRLKTIQDLSPYINDLHFLSPHEALLFSIISELRTSFNLLPHPKRKKSITFDKFSEATADTSSTESVGASDTLETCLPGRESNRQCPVEPTEDQV